MCPACIAAAAWAAGASSAGAFFALAIKIPDRVRKARQSDDRGLETATRVAALSLQSSKTNELEETKKSSRTTSSTSRRKGATRPLR